jgi:predicted ATPase
MRVLATSRRPLGISGEIAWPVPPLALPPPRSTRRDLIATFAAVALFCERASAVRPAFALTDGNAAAVAAICLALDGLPLALELAAARADVLTPAAILARLQNRFDLLVEGGRDVAARQQTLRAALDWSFELLAPDQRRFFARLGVFVGSFGLDAAVTVAGDGFADPLTLLSGLVRHSLVSVAGDDRYRLLDSVRAYAVELLGGEDGQTRDRHASYYTHLAEVGEQKIVGPDQLDWLENMRADVANFRAALDWSFAGGHDELAVRLAGALGWFWTLEGMLDEAMDYLERATARTEVPPLVRSKALWGLALLAASLGHLERARGAGAESAEIARVVGDPVRRARGLNALAVAAWAQGDLGAAARAHDEAISLLEGTDDLWGPGVCLALRARTALDAGDPEGERLARAALLAARASGDRHVIGIALEQLAQLDLAAGRIDSAREAAAECLAMHQAVGYTEGIVAALHVLARSSAAGGDAKEARLLHLRALSLATRIGHTAGVCEALEGLAVLAGADGNLEEVLCLLEAADREREIAQLPLRAPDRRTVDELRRDAERIVGSGSGGVPPPAIGAESTAAVVARLLRSVPEPGR